MHKNVENGFGIFAGFSVSTYVLRSDVPKPVIVSISTQTGKVGDRIILTGENFNSDPNNYTDVIFRSIHGIAHAQTVFSDENKLEVIVPQNAITGKIYVRNTGGYTMSDFEFEVTD